MQMAEPCSLLMNLAVAATPNLGGAFAEVIMEELSRKHAFGIVTTHYLNLKVMAGKTSGIINGAWPLMKKTTAVIPAYRCKPGSSYTFLLLKE